MNPVTEAFRSCSLGAFALSSGAVSRGDGEAAKGDMGGGNASKNKQDQKRIRLAASLRENLKRRKSQQRSRAAEPPPAEPEENERPSSGVDGER